MCDFCKRHPHPHPVVIIRTGEWCIAVRECLENVGYQFVSWGKRGPIVCDNAISEPGEVWTSFGSTQDEAVDRLKNELAALSPAQPQAQEFAC